MKDFCMDYPDVRFELTEGNTYQLVELMKNGLIECAVLRTPFNSEGFRCCYGPKEPLVAVGAASFFPGFACDQTADLKDLAGKPLIYYRRFEPLLSAAFQNMGINPNIFCRNDDARTCLLWAGAGLGIALVPETICNLPLARNLERHPILSPSTTTRMAAVYKKNGYVSPVAREFVSYFKKYKDWQEDIPSLSGGLSEENKPDSEQHRQHPHPAAGVPGELSHGAHQGCTDEGGAFSADVEDAEKLP